MEVPKTIDYICEHFSFVKPWLTLNDKIWSFLWYVLVKCEKQHEETLDQDNSGGKWQKNYTYCARICFLYFECKWGDND